MLRKHVAYFTSEMETLKLQVYVTLSVYLGNVYVPLCACFCLTLSQINNFSESVLVFKGTDDSSLECSVEK